MSLQLEYTALAYCQPQHIWGVFQHIERWPRWDPEAIRDVRWIAGQPWTRGARFEIKIARPLSYTITPEILEVEPPIFLHWRGKGSGVTGEQFFIFKGQPDGTTEMRTLQEFSGAPIKLFGGKVRQPILDGIAHMFARIKSEAEQAARLETAPVQESAPEAQADSQPGGESQSLDASSESQPPPPEV